MAQGSANNTSTSAGGGANNPQDDPFVDPAAADDENDDIDATFNDDSWSSTSTRHPLTRMGDAILRQPGTPGSAIDPQRISTPRRTGLTPSPAARPRTTTPPPAENAPGSTPPPARRNPFNSPLRMPPRRPTSPVTAATNPFDTPYRAQDSPSPSDNDNIILSSGRRRAATQARRDNPSSSDSLRAVAHAHLENSPPTQTRQVSAGCAVSFGFQLSAPPPPRRPIQAHTESRGRHHVRDTGIGRPSVLIPYDGRNVSLSTTATESTSRPSTSNTANSPAPPWRQTTNVSTAGRGLAGRGLAGLSLASPFPDSFASASASNPFSSPNRERTASTEAMKDFDLDGKKKGPFGSLRQKASRVFSKGNDSGTASGSGRGDKTPLRSLFSGKGKEKNEGAGTELKIFSGGASLTLVVRPPLSSVSGGPSPRLPSGGLTPGMEMSRGVGARSPNVNKPLPPPPPHDTDEESDDEGKGKGRK